jgi:nucleotide-binding universal stress UspA family protein
MTVPPRAHATSRLPFRQLLCAVDFSDASLSALRFALSLARDSSSALTVLHVLEWPWSEPPSPKRDELPAAQAAALAEFRRYSEASASTRLESLVPGECLPARVTTQVRNGKSDVQILDVAKREDTDPIVIGVYDRNPGDLAFFGSTTN